MEVRIRTYYSADPPDVDNIIKPILDALNGVAYVDDVLVFSVRSEKAALKRLDITLSPALAAALETGRSEIVYVSVSSYEGPS